LIGCPTLSLARDGILHLWTTIYRAICDRYRLVYDASNIVDVIVDSSILYTKNTEIDQTQLLELEHQSRSQCYIPKDTKYYQVIVRKTNSSLDMNDICVSKRGLLHAMLTMNTNRFEALEYSGYIILDISQLRQSIYVT